MVLQQLDMIERRFDQSIGARLPIFFEQVLFQAAPVHADADRAAIGLRRAHHFGHARRAADIARIDAQTRRARIGGLERPFVMEMDVRNQRHPRRPRDLPECGGAVFIGARYADQVGASIFATADLVDRRHRIRCQRVGHGLHRNRRIPTDGNGADHDLAALASRDIAPGSDR